MKRIAVLACFLSWTVGASMLPPADGSAQLEVTLKDYNGSGARHYTVVWVTTASGAFIKSLRKQGPSSWTSKEWGDHCGTWNTARAGSTVLDGYTSATATSYSGTNSPVIVVWNCRNAANNLVPDGNYKFWVQYAEDSGQGPYTTSGLFWTKGPDAASTVYPNQGANFANMRVVWTPVAAPPIAPTFSSAPPPSAGIVGVSYRYTCTATGTKPIIFSAAGLPPGLDIAPGGVLSGTPIVPGVFSVTIIAANGTTPNATQQFSMDISAVPAVIATTKADGANLVFGGTGPAGGRYTVLKSTAAAQPAAQWTPVATNYFGADGAFFITNSLSPSLPQMYYLLRVP